jgi:pimeloyl-ACP methyl ester carboxylesterase
MHWLLWVFIAIFVIAVIIAVVLAVPLLPIPKFEADPEAAARYHEIATFGREVIIPIPARNQSPAFALHAVEMGSPAASAPLMVFIHGFPETGVTCWSRQLKYFSNLGYRVVAHDQRGFGKNQDDLSRCNHIEGVEDIAAIIRYYRKDDAVVVGHDWGGLVAWLHALRYPQQCRALITVNMPHPLVFKNALFTSLNQCMSHEPNCFIVMRL